jgi:acyl-CoA thioesterase-1
MAIDRSGFTRAGRSRAVLALLRGAMPRSRAKLTLLVAGIATAALLGAFVIPPSPVGHVTAVATTDVCAAPRAVLELGAPLARTGLRLMKGLPVMIIAIGSSSTAGVGASDLAHGYPGQLAAELKRLFPANPITVVNKGISGEETPQMLARFDRDVVKQRPDLVIWQIGSNEILRRHDPEAFRVQAEDGIARLAHAGIDVVLMDSQYSPRLLNNPQYATFNDIMRSIAKRSKVALLDRFEAMRYWLASGRMDMPHMISKDQLHMTDATYHCTGALLARLIEADLPKVAAQ